MRGQNQGRSRRLREVEVSSEVAQFGVGLTHVRSRVGPAVCGGVESLATQKVILDELQIGVMAEELMVDVASSRIGADYEPRDAQSVTVFVDDGKAWGITYAKRGKRR